MFIFGGGGQLPSKLVNGGVILRSEGQRSRSLGTKTLLHSVQEMDECWAVHELPGGQRNDWFEI